MVAETIRFFDVFLFFVSYVCDNFRIILPEYIGNRRIVDSLFYRNGQEKQVIDFRNQ